MTRREIPIAPLDQETEARRCSMTALSLASKAYAALGAGDFKKAEDLFDQLRREALHGQRCSRTLDQRSPIGNRH